MIEEILLRLGGFALVVGLPLAFWRRLKRDVAELDDEVADMRSVPLVRLVDITSDDVVRVVGRVAPEDALVTSPLSGQRCVAYEIALFLYGDHLPLVTGGDATAFYLEDAGVRALVLPPYPIVVLSDRVNRVSGPDELPAAFQEWLEEAHASDDWRREKKLRCVERRIDPGDLIALVGLCSREIDADGAGGGYRDAPSRLVFETAEGAPLSLSDDKSLLSPAAGAPDGKSVGG